MHYKVKRTRARIIKSALAVFAAYGKTGARMNEIANRASVNKAALYYHFSSKDNLYRIVFQSSLRHAVNKMYSKLLTARLSNKTEAIDALDCFWKRHPDIMKLFVHELTEGGAELGAVLSDKHPRSKAPLHKLVAIFMLFDNNAAKDQKIDDVAFIRKMIRIVACSLSRQLTERVVLNIFGHLDENQC